MLYVMSEKQFDKKKKKVVKHKDYLLVDGTGRTSSALKSTYSKVVTMEAFNVPSKLITDIDKMADRYGFINKKEKNEKIFKKHVKKEDFKSSVMALTKGFIENDGDFNIFIIIKNKAYKLWGGRLVKAINDVFKDNPYEFVYLYTDEDDTEDLLRKGFGGKKLKVLSKELDKLEKKLEKGDLKDY